MPELAVDVVVVGMGPGGEDAAGRLAAAGLSVAGVDDRLVGGECPYWGCIPSKMMIRAGNLVMEGRRVQTMRQMIYTFPTFHRAIEAALDDLDEARS